jgi:peptidoglycan/LPS O-acetylase OafA/YrhL
VQLFFFISGFVILMSARRARVPGDFVVSRVSRLYPVYWIAVTVSIIVSVIFRVPSTDIGWVDRLMNYTMIQRLLMFDNVDEVYWTLAIEMQFYMLIFALLLITRNRMTTTVVLVVTGAWFAVSLTIALFARPHTLGLDPQLVDTPWKMLLNLLLVEWGPFFATGMLAYLSREQSKMRPLAITAAAGTVGVSWILHGWLQGLCVAIVATLFMFVVLRNTTGVLRWRIFQFYGRISYSLYIGHAVTGYALLHLIEPYTGRWLGMAVTFIAVTGIAMLYHRIGEVYLTHRMKTALTALRVRQSGPTVSTND